MVILLAIFQYLIQAVVDLMDKFLITARRLEPVKYTFYTVVTGVLLVVLWPWNFSVLPAKFVFLNLFSGAFFALVMYVFFKALAQGEVSRVVPFVFGLVPVFDILISLTTGRNALRINEIAAICLLVPGALLVSHQKKDFWLKHVGLKTLSAFLFSAYYALWQYGAQVGPVLNNLIWNRLGAALALVLLLVFSGFRKKVFVLDEVKNKAGTSVLFLFKQILGGANFIFLSFLFVLGKISIINSLQGFRYVFLLFFSMMLTHKRSHMIKEEIGRNIITQKTFGIALIFLGTIFLFVT
jgi:uncharacterized membrane protein